MDDTLYPILSEKDTIDYVDKTSYYICMKFHCIELIEDIKQDFYVCIMQAYNKQPDKERHLILYEAKHDIYDILLSKKYKERYGASYRSAWRYGLTIDEQWDVSDKSLPTASDLCNKAILDGIPNILSERQSTCLRLNLVNGVSQSELARQYNVSRSMISKDIMAGIKILREKWRIGG